MKELDRSFIYRKFKHVLIEQYGKERAKAMWNDADVELRHLLKTHRDIGTDERMMVFPLYALYVTLKRHEIEDVINLLEMYGKQAGDNLSAMIRKITSIPGLPKLLWYNMPKLMRITSSPAKGYERRIVSESKELVGVDILVCPLFEMAKKLGAPEITSVICLIDRGQMTGFKHIDYTRTKALGNGDDFCDYRLKFNLDKK